MLAVNSVSDFFLVIHSFISFILFYLFIYFFLHVCCRQMQDEFKTYQENVLKLSEEKRKLGQQYDEGAVCEICLKTKFADGVGHSCYYCHKKSCARCGRRVSLKSPKPSDKANEVSTVCFVRLHRCK